MKRLFTAILSVLFVTPLLLAQSYLPTAKGEVIAHKYYTLSYIEEHEQPEWVYYILTPEMLKGEAVRKDNFRADNAVSTGSATLADYKSSGYDRGHLCPAASMCVDDVAMSESFYLSNMSPQAPSFNRGVWKKLEERVRDYARTDSLLHIVTGPIFDDPMGAIGESEVTIPRYYYKAIYSPKREAMIGFVIENAKFSDPVEVFVRSIDEIEQLSGVDFFAEFEQALGGLEASVDISQWTLDL